MHRRRRRKKINFVSQLKINYQRNETEKKILWTENLVDQSQLKRKQTKTKKLEISFEKQTQKHQHFFSTTNTEAQWNFSGIFFFIY